ncbi:MAG: hypothetical protein MKZ70_00700, partial [Opitutales bacterium]|nr:hypothetical protein [Opitutales bacterium]
GRLMYLNHISEEVDHLLRILSLNHGRAVHLFQGVYYRLVVQGYLWLPKSRALPRIECGAPLLILISESNHRGVTLLN